MSFVERFFVIVAAAGLGGVAGAAATDQARDPQQAVAADRGLPVATSVPGSYSFADIADLTATEQRPPAGVFERAPEAVLPELSRIDHAMAARPGVVANPGGAFEDLSSFSSAAATAGSKSGARILLATDEIPAPSGWMPLLCGLAVAAFMARRRRGPPAD